MRKISLIVKLGLVGAILSVIFSGCTATKVSRYGAVYSNVQELKKQNTKINVNTFTAEDSKSSIMCRMKGPIETPNQETFEKYIENALIEELRMADIYSKDAKIVLDGHLKEMSTSTALGLSYWEFTLKVSSNNGKSFTLTSKKEFESSFSAENACNDMTRAFRPAVEKLITDIIMNDEFKRLITKE